MEIALTTTPEHSDAITDTIFRVPRERLITYARLWDFETWLRTMVYVELKAAHGDLWDSRLHKRDTSNRHQQADNFLSHMPTSEALPTSYMQLKGAYISKCRNGDAWQQISLPPTIATSLCEKGPDAPPFLSHF